MSISRTSFERSRESASDGLRSRDRTNFSKGMLCVRICWLSAQPLSAARSYVLRHTTREVKAKVTSVEARLDIHTLAFEAGNPGESIALNDIARIALKTQQPVLADRYGANRATGSFVLIDEATNDTVAAGLIV